MEPLAEQPVPATPGPPATFTLAGHKPLVIILVMLVAGGLFSGISTEPTPLTWASYARWGVPNAPAIWNGAYWGVLSSSFVHVAAWHLVFNLYWLWIFGREIEFEQGRVFILLLVLTAAYVSGVAMLAGGKQGMGLSGVGYALFGYCWVRGLAGDARYQGFLTQRTVWLFLLWLGVCVLLTETGVYPVGNAAHAAGLGWGALLAWLSLRRFRLRYGGLALLLVLAGVPLVWAPWSVAWLSNRAYVLHQAGRLPEARGYYQRVLAHDPASHFARANLTSIEAYELSLQAQRAYGQGRLAQAEALCRQVLRLAPTNAWAQAMLATHAVEQPGQPVDSTAFDD